MPGPDDGIDARLVRALQRDGRASYLELANQLGISRAVVSERLRELIATGTLRVLAAVDPALLGEHVLAHVAIDLSGPARPLAERLTAMPEAVLVSAVSGAAGLVVEFRVSSHEELGSLLSQIRADPRVASLNTRIYTQVVKGLLMPEDPRDIALDPVDHHLIEALQQDGRASYRALAEQVGLSTTAVRSRVARLLDARVIKIGAVEARGVRGRMLSVGVGVNLSGHEDAVLRHLTGAPHVEFVARTVGGTDLIATLAADSPAELLGYLDQLRGLTGVHHLEAWFHLHVFKENYERRMVQHP